MVAIKDLEMPNGCCEFNKETGEMSHCPLYNSCKKRETVKVGVKPSSCPLVEVPDDKVSDWIFVNERLPEKDGNYLCTFSGTYLVGIDHYTTKEEAEKWLEEPEEYAGWRSKNVIAWMPLPKGLLAQINKEG